MSCLSWNCRGLGNPCAVQALQRLIFSKDPTIVFLCKTKSRVVCMERLRVKFQFDSSFSVASRGRSGGLCVFWEEETNLGFRSYSNNHIDLGVGGIGENGYRSLTCFYGFLGVQDRHKFWQLLDRLCGAPDGPWLCLGDFNEIL